MNKFNSKGYTLMELLVTVSLSGVLLFAGVAALDNSIKKQSVKNAAEQFSNALKMARYYTKTKGVPTTISFSTGSNTYSITADDKDITTSTKFGSLSGQLPDGTRITSSSCSELTFDINGELIDLYGDPITYDCYIYLSSNSNEYYHHYSGVIVNAHSGNVKYETYFY